MALFVLQPPPGGLFMNKQSLRARVHDLIDQVERLREEIGSLDDICESPLIDNRDRSHLGAYQLMGWTKTRLEEYIWELKE